MIKNTIFISYSWDSAEHRKKVNKLVLLLRNSGLSVVYDDDMELGDRITHFMEQNVSDNLYVVFICTPKYKVKANERMGGVGYENTIITGELFETQNERKFIPVLFEGNWQTSLPNWAKGKLGIDLSDELEDNQNLDKLINYLIK